MSAGGGAAFRRELAGQRARASFAAAASRHVEPIRVECVCVLPCCCVVARRCVGAHSSIKLCRRRWPNDALVGVHALAQLVSLQCQDSLTRFLAVCFSAFFSFAVHLLRVLFLSLFSIPKLRCFSLRPARIDTHYLTQTDISRHPYN